MGGCRIDIHGGVGGIEGRGGGEAAGEEMARWKGKGRRWGSEN